MGVLKSPARLVASNGAVIGEGRAYLHLRLPESQPQEATGTLSLDCWDDALSTAGATLNLEEGPTLSLSLESDKLSGCIQGRILRYTTTWPGAQS